MKKLIYGAGLAVLMSLVSHSMSPQLYADEAGETAVAKDIYNITLRLKVPQVFNNSTSEGYRRFKNQTIKGEMHIVWQADGNFHLEFSGLENRHFKVGGKNVTYTGREDRDVVYSRLAWIGDNKKDLFKTPTLCFYLELEPSYAIGGNTEDNSFYVLLSGSGTSAKIEEDIRIARRFSGTVAGTQGCGCHAYGHLSPTRRGDIYGPSEIPDDVVPSYGQWQAIWKRRETKK